MALPHVETTQLICRANQLTGFYMRRILVVKGSNSSIAISKIYSQAQLQESINMLAKRV